MASANLLTIHNLSVSYGDFVAVKELSLEVLRGEIFCLLGPNGSGKSSTLGAIGGILPRFRGHILVDGICRVRQPDAYRHRIGVVPQQLALYEELTPVDNLRFFGGFYGLGKKALRRRIEEVLDLVQLCQQKHQPVQTLSGGMQQRVNLACALLHNPPLILLDEPAVGLDVAARDVMQAVLQQLRSANHTILITTHLISEAEQWCDRFGVMYRGQLRAAGTLDELSGQFHNKTQASHDSRLDSAHPGPGRRPAFLPRLDQSCSSQHVSTESRSSASVPSLKQIYAELLDL